MAEMDFSGTPAAPLTTTIKRGSAIEVLNNTTFHWGGAPGTYIMSLVLRYVLTSYVPANLAAWVPGLFNNGDVSWYFINSDMNGIGNVVITGVMNFLAHTDVNMRSSIYSNIDEFLGGLIQFSPYYNSPSLSIATQAYEKPFGIGTGTTSSGDIFNPMTWRHIASAEAFSTGNIASKNASYGWIHLPRDGEYTFILHVIGVGLGASTVTVHDGTGIGAMSCIQQEIVAVSTTSFMTWGRLHVTGIAGDDTYDYDEYPYFYFTFAFSSTSGKSIHIHYSPGWSGT
jgi:hypothetical protein